MRWGPIRGRRLILPEDASEEAVTGFAEATGAEKVLELTASPELGLAREIAWAVRPENFLHFGREHPSGAEFVMVSGDDAEDVEVMTGMLTEYFEPVPDEDLLGRVDRAETVEEFRAALVRAGLGAPRSYDDRFFERVRSAFGADDPGRREAALWAATYMLWPELVPLISETADRDPVDVLRAQARELLKFTASGERA